MRDIENERFRKEHANQKTIEVLKHYKNNASRKKGYKQKRIDESKDKD